MTDAPKPRHEVTQARRFADSLTYNAWSALWRAERLMRDARAIEELLEWEREGDDPPPRSWYGFEVVSYYLVGFVTCLEWHVRTRLADLYTYRPSAIDKEALKGNVAPETLAQMIRDDVSIAHLLSASTTVSSASDYFKSLQHVLKVLGIDRKAATLVPARRPIPSLFGEPVQPPSAYQVLHELFEARHRLVHEIGVGDGPAPPERGNWDIRSIVETGAVVLETLRAFEAVMTAEAPADFPNLLDDHGYPVDQLERLRGEVVAATERVQAQIEAVAEPWTAEVRETWARVVASQHTLQAFIADNRMLRGRHVDQAPALAELELQQRLKLLSAIESAIAGGH